MGVEWDSKPVKENLGTRETRTKQWAERSAQICLMDLLEDVWKT